MTIGNSETYTIEVDVSVSPGEEIVVVMVLISGGWEMQRVEIKVCVSPGEEMVVVLTSAGWEM
jgi:hypothetical protein